MKSARILTIILLLLVTGSVFGQAQGRALAKATIPFDFTVQNTKLPAGTYVVSTIPPYQMIKIQKTDGHEQAMVQASSNEGTATSGNTKLVFDQVGGQYFLLQVWEQGSRVRRDVPGGKLEGELRAQGQPATRATVIAGAAR